MQLIGITGKKRHGKDTIANYLVEHYGATKFAFADELKIWMEILDPYFDAYGEPHKLSDLLSSGTMDDLKVHPDIGPQLRRYLQIIGTEIGRNRIGEDIWVDLTFKKIKAENPKIAVVSDVRFLNEDARIVSEGGLMLKVINPRIPDDGDRHPSEIELEQIVPREIIINEGSLEDLYMMVDDMMSCYV